MDALGDKNGFTLIEILIATVIITVASLGVATLTVGIMRENLSSNRLTTATTLAQDRLEHVKRLGYTYASTVSPTQNYGSIANYSEYKRETTVTNNTPMLKMKTVAVKVSWQLPWDNNERSVILGTILAE
jgi:type IV pilus assembly protein PilV